MSTGQYNDPDRELDDLIYFNPTSYSKGQLSPEEEKKQSRLYELLDRENLTPEEERELEKLARENDEFGGGVF